MRSLMLCVVVIAGLAAVETASAAVISFDLVGVAGDGLLPGNERPSGASGSGSGGEIGSGISFDDQTKVLSILVGWGSQRGFSDLTGVVNAGHLHTAGTGGGILGFGTVLQGLTIADNSASNGFVNTSITLTAPQETLLMAGDSYLNFHTTANAGGEIRGNLVISAVPEPSSIVALAALGCCGTMFRRRRRVR